MTSSEFSRFTEKYEVEANGCWVWTASRTAGGYAQLKIGGRQGCPQYGHRLAYEHFIGPIPAGLELDHVCRNRACVNPSHLEPVTTKENQRRGARGILLTHCPQGHPYDEANMGRVSTTGFRYCRACAREKMRRRKAYPVPRKTEGQVPL